MGRVEANSVIKTVVELAVDALEVALGEGSLDGVLVGTPAYKRSFKLSQMPFQRLILLSAAQRILELVHPRHLFHVRALPLHVPAHEGLAVPALLGATSRPKEQVFDALVFREGGVIAPIYGSRLHMRVASLGLA